MLWEGGGGGCVSRGGGLGVTLRRRPLDAPREGLCKPLAFSPPAVGPSRERSAGVPLLPKGAASNPAEDSRKRLPSLNTETQRMSINGL